MRDREGTLGGSDVTLISTASQIVARLQLENRSSLAIYEMSLPFTIGRSPDCDLCIPDSHVSRHHCEITRIGNLLCLKDTSANGTFIGDRQVTDESVTIEGTTCINLGGSVRLKLLPEAASKERRRQSDRREGEDRRSDDKRRSNVLLINFDRRERHERRTGERRIGGRRRSARG